MVLRKYFKQGAYNLLITAENDVWNDNCYSYSLTRFLEYTEKDIVEKIRRMIKSGNYIFEKLPCLFLYESGHGNSGYVGNIDHVQVSTDDIRFNVHKVFEVPISVITEMSDDLKIEVASRGFGELERTHWAIKRVNLLRQLQANHPELSKELSKPRVFLSYSRSSLVAQHKMSFLTKSLESNGIEPVYDEKDLHPGNELDYFMEKILSDQSITKVLVLCDADYKMRADQRIGGVGKEVRFLSTLVGDSPEQTRVLPLILEKDRKNQPILPNFIQSNFGIDFSSENNSSSLHQLISSILDV